MNILKIRRATRTLGEAQGYQALPVRDVKVVDQVAGGEPPPSSSEPPNR